MTWNIVVGYLMAPVGAFLIAGFLFWYTAPPESPASPASSLTPSPTRTSAPRR